MDYQIRQELDRKADNYKVEELQRNVDNVKRENSDLRDKIRTMQNSIQLLHSALRETLQIFTESTDMIHMDDFNRVLNQL